MNIGERILYLRKELLDITQDKFGGQLGVGKTAISKIEKGQVVLTDQMSKAICREFGVREEWLRNGEGEPFGSQTRNQRIQAFANQVMADEDEAFRKRLIDALAELNEDEWKVLEQIAINTTKKD